MSLIPSREDRSDQKIVQATADAIRSLETVTATQAEYQIGAEDAQDLHYTLQRLRAILDNNGYYTLTTPGE